MRRMKKPGELDPQDLACVVGHLQDAMYFDPGWPGYKRSYKQELSAEDLAQLREVMDELHLSPPGSADDVEKHQKTSEFADFLDGLILTPEERAARDAGNGQDDDALLGSLADAQAGQPVTTTFIPPAPMAAEDIRRGDLIEVVDGKFRLHDRAEAVRRLLAEFSVWSGGHAPKESSFEEREAFLGARDLDAALSLAMWPDRPDRQVP